jgi:ATP-dependent HslUV protease ATP-binding subunit HslU
MEEFSFDASDKAGQKITITAEYVRERVDSILAVTDLRKYII